MEEEEDRGCVYKMGEERLSTREEEFSPEWTFEVSIVTKHRYCHNIIIYGKIIIKSSTIYSPI